MRPAWSWCWWATAWPRVVLGYDSTLPVTMEEMLHHTRATRRGIKRAFLVADMPFGSYHTGEQQALENADAICERGRRRSSED